MIFLRDGMAESTQNRLNHGTLNQSVISLYGIKTIVLFVGQTYTAQRVPEDRHGHRLQR